MPAVVITSQRCAGNAHTRRGRSHRRRNTMQNELKPNRSGIVTKRRNEKMAEFQRGDIVCNRYAGEINPHRYLLYLGKSTITQGRYRSRGYTCLTHNAEKIQLFRDNDQLYRVGHMAEYDSFTKALAALKDFKEEEK